LRVMHRHHQQLGGSASLSQSPVEAVNGTVMREDYLMSDTGHNRRYQVPSNEVPAPSARDCRHVALVLNSST
jgi:hypothetical protein